MKFFGRTLTSARPVIGRVEVLEPNTAVSASCASAFLVTSAFTSRFSNTASTTRSAPFTRA